MRRKRGSSPWRYIIVALALGAIIFGLQYTVRKKFFGERDPELAFVLKPSYFHSVSDKGSFKEGEEKPDRKIAKSELESGEVKTEDITPEKSKKGKFDVVEAVQEVFRTTIKRTTAGEGQSCKHIEYPGDGPGHAPVGEKEWRKTLKIFREAKALLKGWLNERRDEISEELGQNLEMHLNRVVIERPPFKREADLSWRGIVVLYPQNKKQPVIRMGNGFFDLVEKNPKQARFEFARAAAQVWAPCEVQRMGNSKGTSVNIWKPLLSCLGVQRGYSCAPGSYSEAGWAVSSALAAAVAHPGCEIPAFRAGVYDRCVRDIPLSSRVSRIWGGTGY